jgi:hypothetical protein
MAKTQIATAAAAASITLIAVLSGRNKELETKVAGAVRSEPIARAGGRTTPRELTFTVEGQKEAVNARMRVYLLGKKLGEEMHVRLEGMDYSKAAAE